jgi:hypothetical protein
VVSKWSWYTHAVNKLEMKMKASPEALTVFVFTENKVTKIATLVYLERDKLIALGKSSFKNVLGKDSKIRGGILARTVSPTSFQAGP